VLLICGPHDGREAAQALWQTCDGVEGKNGLDAGGSRSSAETDHMKNIAIYLVAFIALFFTAHRRFIKSDSFLRPAAISLLPVCAGRAADCGFSGRRREAAPEYWRFPRRSAGVPLLALQCKFQ